MKEKLETIVKRAQDGDSRSLETVVLEIKDQVYNLSLRMLLYPMDAQDATQEILVKIVTRLSTFKGNSKFRTWVYRVATNYLLTEKSKRGKRSALNFEEYASQLIDVGHAEHIAYTQNKGEQLLLEEEVKISCTHGMLLCLNDENRLVYVLGVILEFTSIEGSEILNITPENFRKQLSRSKTKLRNFLNAKCGLANPKNPCRCSKKIDFLINERVIDPNALRFATQKERSIELIGAIDKLEKSAAIFRSTPNYKTPDYIIKKMRETINLL